MAQTRTLDPLSPMTYALSAQVAYQARDFATALTYAKRATLVDSRFWIGHTQLAQAYAQTGDTDVALETLTDAARFSGTFASGLPPAVVPGLGGVIDVAFIGSTAYALVTLVGPDVGGTSTVGIYRIDGPDSYTVVADIGAFAIANPPATQFDVPTGLQYAIEAFRGGFLVTDGHHNRVLHVSHDGEVAELMAFDNTSPLAWR